MSRDIHNRLRGSCLDCGECPAFISISGRILCDYCGCPPARHERREEDAALKDSYNTGRKALKDSTNIELVKGEVPSRKSSNVSKTRAPAKKLKEDIPPPQPASPFSLSLTPPAANNTRKRKKNMGASLSRAGKTGRRRSLAETGVPEVSEVKMPHRVAELLDTPEPAKATQELHGWNPEDKSVNISVKEDDSTVFHRHPVAQSSDGVRTKTSYSRGLHAFTLTWRTRHRGTHALVGVATDDAKVHAAGYTALVGGDKHSWGWDLGRSKACHGGQHSAYPAILSKEGSEYPATLAKEGSFVVPDKFVMVLDMDAGTLAFVVDGQYLGVAHSGLRGKELFPIVSTVWGHCEISIKYQGGMEPEPLPLMSLCRRVIRKQIGKENIQNGSLEGLNLPKSISKYLEFKNCS